MRPRVTHPIGAGLALVLATVATAHAGAHTELDRVVAVVNGSVILRSELDAKVASERPTVDTITDPRERERRLSRLANQALEEMVDEELIVQAGEAAHIAVDDTEVQAGIDDTKKRFKLDDAGFAQALAQEGLTLEGYRKVMRGELMRYRTVLQLVAPKVTITEEDVRARYDQLQRGSSQPSAVQLAHILIAVPEHPTEQQLSSANAKAQQAMDRIRGGEPFDAVCADVSDDASTKTTGGQLGWLQPGKLDAALEPVVFAMAKDEVKGPISGPKGLHLLKVTDIKEDKLLPFEQMKAQLQRELQDREVSKRTRAWVDELRKKAYVDIHAP